MNQELSTLTAYPEKSTFGFINGNLGTIETVINLANRNEHFKEGIIAIICHPHPLHGGTMHNKVVHTVSKAFNELGIDAIRFNYRGVGKSAGEYGNSIGEAEDLQSIIDWVKSYKPNSKLILAGFSFGSFIALSGASNNKNNCIALISLAPAVNHQNYDKYMPLNKDLPWLLIHGTKDEVIDIDIIYKWLENLSIKPVFEEFENSSHFFHGFLIDLKEAIIKFIKNQVIL